MSPALSPTDARRRLAASPVAVLATLGPDGAPHLVPITFAVEPGVPSLVWSAVDGKPKRAGALRRHANITAHPQVCLLAQHWDADWSRLWWVRADGTAALDRSAGALDHAAGLLLAKYPQYGEVPLSVPVIKIRVHTWRGWAATEPGG